MILFLLFCINYFLIILFTEGDYFIYFLTLVLAVLLLYKKSAKIKKLFMFLILALILFTPFLFQFFDYYIYELYLYLGINHLYVFIGGEVSYILAFLHSFVFFLGYNRKNNL